MTEKIFKNSRHIRWNWEISKENSYENSRTGRFHFVVIDDKNREGILENILIQLSNYHSGLIEIRSVSEKVIGTKFRYLFATYDSPVAPENINWKSIGKPVKRDVDLRERKIGRIEDYVSEVYNLST